MSITYEQFVQNLDDLGIMTADEVRTFQDVDENPEPQRLAGMLVRAGKLTKYQAVRLYQNKHQGLLLGNYLILDRIGRGGMGEVFKAHHRRMKRVVALKVLSRTITESGQSGRRFQREVEAAAKLVHPNIVTAFDADKHKGINFLVMEYVDGKDLAALLKQTGPFTVSQSLDCIIQAARGLQFAHESRVVHRDIKPQNMLIDSKGCIKILDMGLVRMEDGEDQDSSEGLTQHNQIMGSIDYMSPEQAEDISNVDARADIYSLGCTLFRLLTGKAPYKGEKLIHKLVAHRQHPIPSLLDFRDDVPRELDLVFQQMLAKKREERPDSMIDVIKKLEACQEKSERHRDGQAAAISTALVAQESDGFEVNESISNSPVENIDADSAMLQFVQSLDTDAEDETTLNDDEVIALEPIDDFVTNETSTEESGSPRLAETTVQKSGDSETMPALQVRQDAPSELSRQWKGDKRILLLQIVAGFFVLGLTVLAWYLTRSPQLVIDWPLQDRPGVMIRLNEENLGTVPGTNPVRINVNQGIHKLEFRRRGYEWIEMNIKVERGQRLPVTLKWVPITFPKEGAPENGS